MTPCERYRLTLCVVGKGIVMFTGYSHRGVVNASRSAIESLAGSVPLHAVLGGYHLVGCTQSHVEETVRDLKAFDPKVLLPGHCSGWRGKYEIEKQMPGRLVVLWEARSKSRVCVKQRRTMEDSRT
jgi:7,8-dihydropterin-6-yl-methyl-4-(beta-D-ribofuranosyl)aminobenzene 5'-phosphate synthase